MLFPGVLRDVDSVFLKHFFKLGYRKLYMSCESSCDRNMFEDVESIADFWKLAPPSTSYLFFVRNSTNATKSALWMKEKMGLGVSSRSNTRLSDKLHFSTQVLHQAGGWVGDVLQNWISPQKRIEFCWSENKCCFNSTRLDADYSWIPWPMTGVRGRLAFINRHEYKTIATSRQDLENAVAILYLEEDGFSAQESSWVLDILLYVESKGAKAVIFIGYAGKSLFPLKCRDRSECDTHRIQIPVTMIPYEIGERLVNMLGAEEETTHNILVTATEIDGPSLHAGIDANGHLYEVGWTKFPSLSHAAWGAQWNAYLEGLNAQLTNETDTLVVDIYKGDEDMVGEHGLQRKVTLPQELWENQAENEMHFDASEQSTLMYRKLELDLHLGCPGARDADCPVWDHMVQLFVCCESRASQSSACDPCPTTLWAANLMDKKTRLCGREIGRWATPFRRRSGRWVTDVSHLAPLISSQTCTFTIQSTPWAGAWRPKLSLRFSDRVTGNSQKTSTHMLLTPIPFTSQVFDSTYNSKFDPYKFPTPSGLLRALLVVYITGHGSDEHNCAEFCITSHHFKINSREYSVASWTAGSEWGCAERVNEGVVPNQHGTWMFGRNGWCDGQNVKPYIVDITSDLLPYHNTRNNSLIYYAKYNDQDPNPHQSPGYIMMTAHLQLLTSTEEKSTLVSQLKKLSVD
jgi:hypothetical protein